MELLCKLYGIHSKSGHENLMTEFVAKCCENIGAKVTIDEHGNVFATKGENKTYPCVVAHLDQVQTHHSHDFALKMEGDIIYAISESFRGPQGLGADDKNGIWVCLKALSRFDNIKCAFFVGEEIGCIGSSKADMDFFADCRFVLQCDRKGSSDLITVAGGVELCSKAFIDAVGASDFGYSETTGLMTDVMELKERGLAVSACNISCGYYGAHTDSEVTVISELKNCFDFVCHIIENCLEVYHHEYEAPKWKSSGYSYNRSFLHDDFLTTDKDGYNCYSWKKNEVKEEKEEDDDLCLENDMISELYELLYNWPQMSFKFYWKNYGKYWSVKKARSKELFDMVKDDVYVCVH